jgi:hypothetical protein
VIGQVSRGITSRAEAELQHPSQCEAQLELKAARMHQLSRLRGEHFASPVMADSALEVMLSLLIGELQNHDVSERILAAATLLSRKGTDALIDQLVQAGLAVITGHEPEGRTVGLSPLGSARMRSFMNDHPDV